MKKVFHVLSFAFVHILFSGFTSTESSTISPEEVDYNSAISFVDIQQLSRSYQEEFPVIITYAEIVFDHSINTP